MDPDLPLLEKIQHGEEPALRELIDRYREPVFRFVWRYVRNDATAGDITEETFVKVYFNAPSFRPSAKVSTWIFSIATNLCHDHHRKTSRRKVLSLFAGRDGDPDTQNEWVDRLEDASVATGRSVLDREDERLVASAVDGLPSKLKSAFILFALEGRDQRECADILQTSPKTVEMRVYRARQRLREELGEHFHR